MKALAAEAHQRYSGVPAAGGVVKRPTLLTLDEVLALLADQVERYGGEHGVRDISLLESAIAMRQMALVFLGLNGFELEADADGLTEMVLGVAAGKVS